MYVINSVKEKYITIYIVTDTILHLAGVTGCCVLIKYDREGTGRPPPVKQDTVGDRIIRRKTIPI